MTTRQALIVGGIVGLVVSSALLALLWFGVAGAVVGKTNLMYVFWPAPVMLVVGWRRTIPGMMITASAVATQKPHRKCKRDISNAEVFAENRIANLRVMDWTRLTHLLRARRNS